MTDWIDELEKIADDRFRQIDKLHREFYAQIKPCTLERIDLCYGFAIVSSAQIESTMPDYHSYSPRPGDWYTIASVFANRTDRPQTCDIIVIRSREQVEHSFMIKNNPIILEPGQLIELSFRLEIA